MAAKSDIWFPRISRFPRSFAINIELRKNAKERKAAKSDICFSRISRFPRSFAIIIVSRQIAEKRTECENGHMFSAYFAFSAFFRDKIKDCEKKRKRERQRKVIYGFRVFRVLSQLKRK